MLEMEHGGEKCVSETFFRRKIKCLSSLPSFIQISHYVHIYKNVFHKVYLSTINTPPK